MSEFDELLSRAVMGISEAYEAAERDLVDEITAASESVKRLTGGEAALALQKVGEGTEGTAYSLVVVTKSQLYEIVTFQISSSGYPISISQSKTFLDLGMLIDRALDKGGIRKYFVELASQPDSPLVTRIAFILRHRRSDTNSPGKE